MGISSQGVKVQELRTSKRFPVRLPIRFLSPETGVGSTDNISAAGCFLRADMHFDADSTIGFLITIPGAYIGLTEDVTVRCQGKVLRCEAQAEGGYEQRAH